jgi:hypothetical protein
MSLSANQYPPPIKSGGRLSPGHAPTGRADSACGRGVAAKHLAAKHVTAKPLPPQAFGAIMNDT